MSASRQPLDVSFQHTQRTTHPFLRCQRIIGNRSLLHAISAHSSADQSGAILFKDRQGRFTGRPHDRESEWRSGDSATLDGREEAYLRRSQGTPLPLSLRTYFEPRFGADFRGVQFYKDRKARALLKSVNAQSCTLGENIFYDASQLSPYSRRGQHVLAHELTHVLQQTGAPYQQNIGLNQPVPTSTKAPENVIQRMTPIVQKPGTPVPARPPGWWRTANIRPIPASELKRVQQAIGLVKQVVNNPKGFSSCHGFFRRNCHGGKTFAQTFNAAKLWRITDSTCQARGDAPGTVIAYTLSGYSAGTENLAKTLVHELMHNCGVTGKSDHYLAEFASMYCMGAGRNRLSFEAGVDVPTGSAIGLITYRRILTEWLSGRLRLGVGGDVGVTGLAYAFTKGWRERERPGEFGAGMVGLYGRTSFLWGGERYGGLTGRIETGFGAGHFMLRNPKPEEARTAVAGDFILQLGIGAEFLIPLGLSSGSAMPLNLKAAYRLVQPLNPRAKQMHGLIISLGIDI